MRMKLTGRGPLWALAAAMVVALSLFTAASVVAGSGGNSDVQATAGEGVNPEDHSGHVRDAAKQERYDAELRARCQDPAYLAANPALCPNPSDATARAAVASLAAAPPPALGATLAAAGDVGVWSAPADLGIGTTAQHTVLLPTGKVLIVGPAPPATANTSRAAVWDPATGATQIVNPPVDPRTGLPFNLWCAGQSLLPNGTVLFAGGNDAYVANQVNWRGLATIFTFNPFNNTWTRQPDMALGRWYPTTTLLGDGRVVIFGGQTVAPTYQPDIEVFTPHPTNRDGVGTLQLIDRNRNPGLYPIGALLPNGNILYAGPRPQDAAILNTGNFSFQDLTNVDQRYWGAMTITDEGAGQRLLRRIGGADLGLTATQKPTAIKNLDNPTGNETVGASLNTARAHLNAVILPTGEILAVGGGLGQDANGTNSSSNYVGPIFQSELFSPTTNTWTPVASQIKPRTYHSTAVLLPDGRVFSGGDDRRPEGQQIGDVGVDQYEIYTPPYLRTGTPRPTITSAPASVAFNTAFAVQTPDAASITRAVLIHPGAVTHANDMSQRSIKLNFTVAGTTLNLTSPSGSTIAPAGHYMLFLVNNLGVPTVARYIAVGTAAAPGGGGDTTPPAVTVQTPAPGATGVAVAADVVADFNEPLNPTSITSRFTLAPTAGGPAVAATVTASNGNARATLNPTADLAPSTQYTATLAAGITDVTGNPTTVPTTWNFTTAAPAGGPEAFLMQGGQVVFEAENEDGATTTATRSWQTRTTAPGFVGAGYMVTEPDGNTTIAANNLAAAPRLDYRVNFEAAGTYRLWVRGSGPSGASDSIHLGLDGVGTDFTVDFPVPGTAFTWKNKSGTAVLNVPSAGVHTVNLWMREDGARVDRVLITTSTATPTGDGPAESPRGTGSGGGDTTPPTVIQRAPAPAATGVVVGANVVIDFDEVVDPASVTAARFQLAPTAGGAAVTGTITPAFGNTRFTLDPTADLAAGTQYTVTVAAGITDTTGNPTTAPDTWSFTTASAGDTTPPGVTAQTPAPGASGVAVAADVVADFNEPLNPTSITSRFTLAPTAGGPAVAATVTASNGDTRATLNPTADLAPSTQYTATLAAGITDVTGNPTASDTTWTFTTAAPVDTTPPGVTSRTPAPAATDVGIAANVIADFDEALDPTTATVRFTLAPTAGGPALAATVTASAGDTRLTLDPTADLAYSTQYTATLAAGIEDVPGNPTAAPTTWSFTTAAPPGGPQAFLMQGGQVVFEAESFDGFTSAGNRAWAERTTAPGFVGTGYVVTEPDNNLTVQSTNLGGAPRLDYLVNFEAAGTYKVWVRGSGPNSAGDSIHLGLDGAGAEFVLDFPVPGTAFTWKNKTGTATITVPSAGVHTVNLWMREDGARVDRILITTSTATPSGDGPPQSPRGGSGGGDTTPPGVTARTPAPGATGVAVGADVVTDFDEAIAPASLSGRVTLAPTAGGGALAATVTPSNGNARVTLDPTADLAPSTQYTATLAAGITDVTGNPTAADVTWTFTTAAGAPQAFLMQSGEVVFEAESNDGIANTATRSWVTRTTEAGFVGAGYVVTEPDNNLTVQSTNLAAAPRLDYLVNFEAAGTYKVWVRGSGPNSAGDSIHLGLDGAGQEFAVDFPIPGTAFTWKNKSGGATITVPSAGVHTVNLWMREDGARVDRIILTNAITAPIGDGPPQSPRG